MGFEVNGHVDRLNNYLPLDANSSALFQEYVDPGDHPAMDTRALQFLLSALGERSDLRLLVLTGDAGHGKTYLCAKVLEHFGYSPVEASRALIERCDGSEDLATLTTGRALRVVKDLSDLPIEAGASLLEQALVAEGRATIACANEGRLRSALAFAPDALEPIARSLEEGVQTGRLDVDPRVVVLNLNFQSVASAENRLAVGAFRWAIDGRRWRACSACDARPRCPIYENQDLLADRQLGRSRIEALERLLHTAEQIGAVITIRELLMLMAYTITGGIRCTDVHRRAHGRTDWQYEYQFSQNIFGDRLAPAQIASMRSMRQLRLIDPGTVSVRAVDDEIVPSSEGDGGRFLPRAGAMDTTVRTRAQARNAAEATRSLYRFLRRRKYFMNEAAASSASLGSLGFTFGDQFAAVTEGDLEPAEERRLRDRLIAGLEAVQGMRRFKAGSHLLLVDPAFGTGTTAASIVARRIRATSVHVRSQSAAWHRRLDRAPDLPAAVDWSDRAVVMELGTPEAIVPLHLDLLTFEFLMRAGEGLDGRSFFDAEIRRISGAVAPLVLGASDDDQIEIVREGRLEALVIDTGNVIRKVEDG